MTQEPNRTHGPVQPEPQRPQRKDQNKEHTNKKPFSVECGGEGHCECVLELNWIPPEGAVYIQTGLKQASGPLCGSSVTA